MLSMKMGFYIISTDFNRYANRQQPVDRICLEQIYRKINNDSLQADRFDPSFVGMRPIYFNKQYVEKSFYSLEVSVRLRLTVIYLKVQLN